MSYSLFSRGNAVFVTGTDSPKTKQNDYYVCKFLVLKSCVQKVGAIRSIVYLCIGVDTTHRSRYLKPGGLVTREQRNLDDNKLSLKFARLPAHCHKI